MTRPAMIELRLTLYMDAGTKEFACGVSTGKTTSESRIKVDDLTFEKLKRSGRFEVRYPNGGVKPVGF